MFDIKEFARLAPEWSQRLHFHSELGSTNDEALRLCAGEVKNGTVVLADHQTSGRGRRGAAWMSQPGGGVLFSLILKPGFDKQFWPRFALASGLAIAKVLRDQWGLPAEVKWPNDVLVNGQKCCGILVETQGDYAVIGIGINVTASPEGNESVALAELVHRAGSREELLMCLLEVLTVTTADCSQNFQQLIDQLRGMCYLTGKTIRFTANGISYVGEARGISDDGALLVEINGGVESFMQAEQIRLCS